MHGTDDIFEGKWDQIRGSLKMWWNDLTDDDIDYIKGSRQKLVGKLKERYGWDQNRAETEVNRQLSQFDPTYHTTTNVR